MARLAIFIDGAYLDNLCRQCSISELDFNALSSAIRQVVADASPEAVDLLRTFYYNCPPYQGNPPTPDESARYANHRRFADALKNLSRFEFREGRLEKRGYDQNGKPIFQQKRVDLMLGVDVALLSGKRQIGHIALVAGDSDLIPAVQAAKLEGIATWLFHGPPRTYHRDLWQEADDRYEVDGAFLSRCKRA